MSTFTLTRHLPNIKKNLKKKKIFFMQSLLCAILFIGDYKWLIWLISFGDKNKNKNNFYLVSILTNK